MKRGLTVLLALAMVALVSGDVFGWLIPFSKERIAAAGKHCVHGYDGNLGAVGTYYAGDASALNEQLAKLDEPRDEFPPGANYVSKKVILHPGPMIVPKYIEPMRELSTDWLVTSWRGSHEGRSGLLLQIDVWLGGRIKLDDLQIPADFTVESGREIEEFVERRKSQDQ